MREVIKNANKMLNSESITNSNLEEYLTNKEEVLDKQEPQVEQEFRLYSYYAVTQVRSIRRSMRRGKVTPYGLMAPKRPYNNRANTSERTNVHSRVNNMIKRALYDRIK